VYTNVIRSFPDQSICKYYELEFRQRSIMIEVNNDRFELRPEYTIDPLPKFGDRIQLRLAGGFRELILAQINSVEGNWYTCTVVGVFDWDSKSQVTGGGALDTYNDKEIRTTIDFVWKVVYANELYRGKWASSVAIKYTKEMFEGILDVGLEEIYYSDSHDEWVVTIGFRRPWDKPHIMMAPQKSPMQYRTYKKMRVDNTSGEITSVENRAADGGSETFN